MEKELKSESVNVRAIQTLTQTVMNMLTLREEEFYYGHVINKWDESKVCGSVCCVGGWYPKWYPESFKWNFYHDTIESKGSLNFSVMLSSFHNIDHHLVGHLFYPGAQDIRLYGGVKLDGDATIREVISNFEIVINKLRSGEIK